MLQYTKHRNSSHPQVSAHYNTNKTISYLQTWHSLNTWLQRWWHKDDNHQKNWLHFCHMICCLVLKGQRYAFETGCKDNLELEKRPERCSVLYLYVVTNGLPFKSLKVFKWGNLLCCWKVDSKWLKISKTTQFKLIILCKIVPSGFPK